MVSGFPAFWCQALVSVGEKRVAEARDPLGGRAGRRGLREHNEADRREGSL
jgi:hypothetical protein